MDLCVCVCLFAGVYRLQRKILYTLVCVCECVCPPLWRCELHACVCVYMNVPQFTPLHPHSAAVPPRTLVK